MDSQKTDLFLLMNSKYFHDYQLASVRKMIEELDDAKWNNLQLIQFKDPTTALIISLIGGSLGIDRFYIGDMGLGIAKLLTCGGLSIWALVDWFLIMNATRDKNLQKLQMTLAL